MNDHQTQWTFLTNHFHVLVVLSREPNMRIKDIATKVQITERAVQRIIAELVEDQVICIEKCGRRNSYKIDQDHQLKHPLESKHTVGELLAILTS